MSDPPISVLLIEDNPGDTKLISEFLVEAKGTRFDLVCADRLAEGIKHLQSGSIDVVLLDLTLPDSQGFATFRALRKHAQDVPIVVLSGIEDDALAMQAVREGAHDYLVKGNVKGSSLVRVIRYSIERQRAQSGPAEQGARSIAGRIVGFIGAKGGVGTTTVALNVAAAMSRHGHAVIAAEFGPGWGTFSALLNHTPAAALGDIAALPVERIDAEALAPFLYKDTDALQILFGPQQVEDYQELEPAKAEVILRTLARMADYTIVDLSSHPSRANAGIIPLCHHVAVVIGRDPACLVSARRTLDFLKARGARPERLSAVVVNRTPLTTPIDTAEIGAALSCDVLVVIPNAMDACLRAQKMGVPLVVADPGIPASARLMQLADWLATQGARAIKAT